MKLVEDAIILAAGNGTRMLPASFFSPKEALPLIDTPLLYHLVWEAKRAGVKRVHLVLSKKKERIIGPYLESSRNSFGENVRRDLPDLAFGFGDLDLKIIIHIQEKQNGVGDAIHTALSGINGPFLVLLGDNIFLKEHIGPLFSGPENASSLCHEMVKTFEKNGKPIVGAYSVSDEEIVKYGSIGMNEGMVTEILEKAPPENAPSSLILCGRYLLDENAKNILEDCWDESSPELLSIAMLRRYMETSGLMGMVFDDYQMYDSGDPLSWMKSQIDHALRREDMGGFREWLKLKIRNLE